jgi:hypothetical protein
LCFQKKIGRTRFSAICLTFFITTDADGMARKKAIYGCTVSMPERDPKNFLELRPRLRFAKPRGFAYIAYIRGAKIHWEYKRYLIICAL